MTRPPFDTPTAEDVRIVSRQLGRPARDVVGIAARCACGAPTVVSTRPRLADGTPFPTFYYLTHPAATAAVSTLEAEGEMPGFAALLVGGPQGAGGSGAADSGAADSGAGSSGAGDDSSAARTGTAIAAGYLAAHESYIADRETILVVDEVAGISAGGMPDRVKCLHALVGHALAAGPGVNPIGDLALERAAWNPAVCECVDYDRGDRSAGDGGDLNANSRGDGDGHSDSDSDGHLGEVVPA